MQAGKRSLILSLVSAAILATTLVAGNARAVTFAAEATASVDVGYLTQAVEVDGIPVIRGIRVTEGLSYAFVPGTPEQYSGGAIRPDLTASTFEVYDSGSSLTAPDGAYNIEAYDSGGILVSRASAQLGVNGYALARRSTTMTFSGSGTATFLLPYSGISTSISGDPGGAQAAYASAELMLAGPYGWDGSGNPPNPLSARATQQTVWFEDEAFTSTFNEGVFVDESGANFLRLDVSFTDATDGVVYYLEARSSATADTWVPTDPVPEPATMALLGSGLLGLAGLGRRRRK